MSNAKLKPPKQPWIDYLIDTVSKEPDSFVKDKAPICQQLLEDFRLNNATEEFVQEQINNMKNEILPKCTASHRVEKIFDGIAQFILKEQRNVVSGANS